MKVNGVMCSVRVSALHCCAQKHPYRPAGGAAGTASPARLLLYCDVISVVLGLSLFEGSVPVVL